MSGATAKAVRRDLRRAVGEEAAGIIDAHTQAIDNQIIPNINTLTAQRDNHENRIRLLESQMPQRAMLRLGGLENHAKMLSGSFWRRLRWLMTGR